MNIRPIGGIFWRIASDGNLTAFDPAGNIVGKFLGGTFVAKSSLGTLVINAEITTTTSTANVLTGAYIQITINFTARALVIIHGNLRHSAASGIATMTLYRISGLSSPVGGTGVTGWTLTRSASTQTVNNANTAALGVEAPFVIIDSPGNGTWTYGIAFSGTVGTTTFLRNHFQAIEM